MNWRPTRSKMASFSNVMTTPMHVRFFFLTQNPSALCSYLSCPCYSHSFRLFEFSAMECFAASALRCSASIAAPHHAHQLYAGLIISFMFSISVARSLCTACHFWYRFVVKWLRRKRLRVGRMPVCAALALSFPAATAIRVRNPCTGDDILNIEFI